VTNYGHFIASIADGELLGGNIVTDVLGEPLLLVHAAMDGDGGEVLLHQQLREGDAALHRLHEYHNLNTDIFSITKFLFYGFKNLMKKTSICNKLSFRNKTNLLFQKISSNISL